MNSFKTLLGTRGFQHEENPNTNTGIRQEEPYQIYRLTFLGNLMVLQARGSLLSRHFFPPIPPIKPWALERVARAILSLLVAGRLLSWLVVSSRSAELSELRERRLSVVVGGSVLVAVMGVVERVSVFARVLASALAGGDVRRSAVGFWSRPLHTCNPNLELNISAEVRAVLA